MASTPHRAAAAASLTLALVGLTGCGGAGEPEAAPEPQPSASEAPEESPAASPEEMPEDDGDDEVVNSGAVPELAEREVPDPDLSEACEMVATAIEVDLALHPDTIGAQFWLSDAQVLAPEDVRGDIGELGEVMMAARDTSPRDYVRSANPGQQEALQRLVDHCDSAGVDLESVEAPKASVLEVCTVMNVAGSNNNQFRGREELLNGLAKAAFYAPEELEEGVSLILEIASVPPGLSGPELTAKDEAAVGRVYDECERAGVILGTG